MVLGQGQHINRGGTESDQGKEVVLPAVNKFDH